MTTPFAINGLGRIGRALLRIAAGRGDVEVVAVNDPVPAAALARLVARDTMHGPFAGKVVADGSDLVVDGRRVPVTSAARPAECSWEASGARVVVEASGRFLERAAAAGHLAAEGEDGVERVILSANAPDPDVTLCRGVNFDAFDPERHRVLSNSSCTTNCLAPLLRILDDAFGVERVVMSTVHSYTGNQRLVDSHHAETRRSRAAAANLIPVATSAARAVGRLMPKLAGRVAGLSVRVPTAVGAMMEIAADLASDADTAGLRDALRAAAADDLTDPDLAAVVAVSDEELVSSDFVGSPHSAVVDLPLAEVVDRRLARVVAWYDNEWGYATRLADLVSHAGGGRNGS